MLLGREQKLEPGLAEVLDRTAATVQSYELAADPSWKIPYGWFAQETSNKEYRVGVDHRVVHGGKSSLFLRSLVAHPSGVITVYQKFDAVPYQGKRVRLTAFLRTEAVIHRATLSLGATSPALAGQSASVEVSGTTPWKKYELVADVPGAADLIEFLVTLDGAGTVWADDFAFEQVDKSVPVTVRQPENLDFTK